MPDERIIGERYRVEGVIGQGGMGTVYHGVDVQTQTPVAIKQLRPELVEINSDVVQRFAHEAEALRKLNHPNIIKVLATINESGHHYIVMEYISGGSLEAVLGDTPLMPVDRVLNIALDLSDALTRAHRLKIIHRDIKPANVLLREDGSPILTDFGIARMSTATRVTETGIIMGTMPYLSPESLYGEAIDESIDLWALGVMLYEMLAGVRPFGGETVGALVNNILTRPVADFYTYRSDIPWTLMGLVYWMLEKPLQDRPSSVRLIGAMLENIMSGDVIPAQLDKKIQASPDYRPNREEAIRAVIDYATMAIRPDGAKVLTPTPTEVAAILSKEAEPPASPTVILDAPRRPFFHRRLYWRLRGRTETPDPKPRSSTLKQGRYWLAGAFALALAGLVVFVFAYSPPPTTLPPATASGFPTPVVSPSEHVALVAQFKHLGGAERNVQRFIVENLQRNFESSPYSDMRIRMYDKIIDDAETARQIGEAMGVEVVIWGDYDAEGVTAEVQLGSTAKFPLMILERADLEKLVNVRVTMTNERRETLAYNIVAVINLLSSATGDSFSLARNLLIVSGLNDVPATIPDNDMAAHYHRYIRFYFEDPAASVEEMTKAIRLDANDPMPYAIRALGYQHLGDQANAQVDIRTAERLGGRDWIPALMLRITDTLFINPNYPAAIGHLDRFIAQRPEHWWAISLRGMAHYMLGDYVAAETDMQASIAMSPEASYPYSFVIAIQLRRGDLVGAQNLLRQVLENFPDPTFTANILLVTLSPTSADNFFVTLNAAFGHVILQRWQDVLNDTQASAEAALPMVDIYFLRGFAYCNLDQHEAAEAAYTRALEIDDSFSLLYLMRADIRQKRQDLIGAATDLTTAMSRPELQWLQPTFTLDKLGDIDCKSFLETDFVSLKGTSEATP